MSWFKKLAEKISSHGNSPTHKDGFSDWWSSQTSTNHILIREEALNLYRQAIGEKEYNKLYNEKSYTELSLDALRYYYDNVLHPSIRDASERSAKRTNAQNAATVSALGAGISFIPHPAAKIAGSVLSVPDLMYDTADLIANPSVKNVKHEAADVAEPVGNGVYTWVRATPTKIDDILPAVLKGFSIYDDLSEQSDKHKLGGTLNYLNYIS